MLAVIACFVDAAQQVGGAVVGLQRRVLGDKPRVRSTSGWRQFHF
jgi:hypothetical protein